MLWKHEESITAKWKLEMFRIDCVRAKSFVPSRGYQGTVKTSWRGLRAILQRTSIKF